MHNTKSKLKGVSASSFFDLKAEVSKAQDKAGKPSYLVSGAQRPAKKPTKWGLSNKGVKSRAERDEEQEIISKPTLDSAQAALERKAKIYDQLSRGKTGGLSDKQFGSVLVNFDEKGINSWESDSDDVDESLTVPVPPSNDEDDPIIEYIDDLGRTRSSRRSEVPREFMPRPEEEVEEEEEGVLYNPQGHYPVYEPTAERAAEIHKQYSEENNPVEKHYDSNLENRAKGAAHYKFSSHGEAREKELAELKSNHIDVQAIRAQTGAVDVRPGEIEGMRAPESSLDNRSALEKRKRELEERKKMVDAKRKKTMANVGSQPATNFANSAVGHVPEINHNSPSSAAPADPFALVEAATFSMPSLKTTSSLHDADEFLAEMQNTLLPGKKGR